MITLFNGFRIQIYLTFLKHLLVIFYHHTQTDIIYVINNLQLFLQYYN